jgi:putative aminopeptidase FrvX
MNTAEFKKLLAVPTTSNYEDHLVEYLFDHLRTKSDSIIKRKDAYNNVYIIKQNSDRPLPCVAAHIDSVQPLRQVNIVESGGFIHAENNQGTRLGFGADDKTGVQVCLELLERLDHIAVMFFAAEEIGAQGAHHAEASFFKSIGYLIEYDCPSRGLVSYTSGGRRLFENGGQFITRALPVLQKHGSTLWQRHPYSDVMAVRKRFPISCLNLSSGYYNWHEHDEFVKISDVEWAIEQGEELIRTLDNEAYPCPQWLNEDMPAIEIGPLFVPEA